MNGGGGFDLPGNIDIPTDPSLSTFNWIYNYIYSILNSIVETGQQVIIEFTPFGFSSRLFYLSINSDLVKSHLENYPEILSLLQLTYWFVISYYIINDIRKYVEKIKNGDIMSHTDTNIKAEML